MWYFCAKSGLKSDITRAGNAHTVPDNVEKKSTGNTALPCTAPFLATSYMPKKKADNRLNISHITSCRHFQPEILS